jgi:hypothetical protein
MLRLLLNCFSIGACVPDIHIFSSASKSKWPAVSMLKYLPVNPAYLREYFLAANQKIKKPYF